jgi:cytochrome c oxidase subunit 3
MSVTRADGAAAPETPRSHAPADPAQAKAGMLGMTVFMIVLGFFFAAGLLAYLVARTGRLGHIVTSGAGVEHVAMPVWFWPSTLVILIASVVLHAAHSASRADRPERAGNLLLGTSVLGVLFLALQIPGLVQLVRAHRVFAAEHVLIYALVIFLVGLHALHVLGGLGYLAVLASRARRQPFDASRAFRLRPLSVYWHFLAAVWLVMFNTFLLVG